MVLIADSGSTKCDWRCISADDGIQQFHTKGYNPFYFDSAHIESELRPIFEQAISLSSIRKVAFYGAGCSDTQNKTVVKNALQSIFRQATIIVEHDLLGAARAACGTQAGIVCILGTGSNSCLFDGKQIIDNIPSLGFLMGDEGSGSYLGKALIRSYAYREMPDALRLAFEEHYQVQHIRSIIQKVYRTDTPNTYLASFVPFCKQYQNHPFIQKIIQNVFLDFLQRHVSKYAAPQTLPIHFIGSIAYYFQDILTFVLRSINMTMGIIIRKPIDALAQYHVQHDAHLLSNTL